MTPETIPMINAPAGPTKPAAGVTPTKPAIAPDAPPNNDGRPLITHSVAVQAKTAPAVAIRVLKNASAAVSVAPSAEPALKPNQPTNNSDAPISVIGKLWGFIDSLP